MELNAFSWATLRNVQVWKHIEAIMQTLDTLNFYDAAENSTKLDKEFRYVKNYCSETKIKRWNDANVPIPKRWIEIFRYLENEICEYKQMAKMVEIILCRSTASVERDFTAINKNGGKNEIKN